MGCTRPRRRTVTGGLTEQARRHSVAGGLALLITVASWLSCGAQARGATSRADASTASGRIARELGKSVPRSPSEPALTGSSGATGTATPTSEPSVDVGAQQPDPLAGNGLGSPACGANARGALSSVGQRSCESSGFVAAAYPTADYGLDVHIDTGVLGLSQGGFMSAVQDLLVTPVWMALLWAVHAMVVMLEWGFAIDLLDSPVGNGLGAGLGGCRIDHGPDPATRARCGRGAHRLPGHRPPEGLACGRGDRRYGRDDGRRHLGGGIALDVPLGHKDAAFVRSHFDGDWK